MVIRLDFFGTLGSVIFAYAGPFFLKYVSLSSRKQLLIFSRCLLDAIDHPDRTSRDKGTAYNYAGLMFICSILKVNKTAAARML